MDTNLALDDKLIIQAQKIGHHRTKREAVTIAIEVSADKYNGFLI